MEWILVFLNRFIGVYGVAVDLAEKHRRYRQLLGLHADVLLEATLYMRKTMPHQSYGRDPRMVKGKDIEFEKVTLTLTNLRLLCK